MARRCAPDVVAANLAGRSALTHDLCGNQPLGRPASKTEHARSTPRAKEMHLDVWFPHRARPSSRLFRPSWPRPWPRRRASPALFPWLLARVSRALRARCRRGARGGCACANQVCPAAIDDPRAGSRRAAASTPPLLLPIRSRRRGDDATSAFMPRGCAPAPSLPPFLKMLCRARSPLRARARRTA